MKTIIERLVDLSHGFGLEQRAWAVLGEGNTSARKSEDSFLVKASGSRLGNASASDFTEVSLSKALHFLENEDLSDEAVQSALAEIQVNAGDKMPSVETFVHAVCLAEGACDWVGHGHPISVLSILCSQAGAKPYLQPIFPDAIVMCGRHVAVVPYIEPGFKLALAVRQSIRDFERQHGQPPKVILLENHGPFILGKSALDVENTMIMLDKWSKILVANQAFGGANPMSTIEADRIENRLDEAYRRKRLLEKS